MDTKALAKSKRAHSLHHSKKHHHQKPTPVSPAAAKDAPKQTASQVTGTAVHQQSKLKNALPSNWDRYDDEDDPDLRNYAHDSLVKSTDVPKSKGADYAYLISEAKSQLSSENFPSLDDDVTDFYQGLGPLLSVKGQGILSWIDDDNFDVDDDNSTANVEASFLSLDLNALSGRLEKMDLCERLFIETDDLLSEELSALVSEQMQHEEEVTENSFVGEKDNNASSSEAELDILLNSFSESKFLDSITTPNHAKSYFKVENQMSSTSHSKPTSMAARLDDDLDDLLNLPQPQLGAWTSNIGGAMPTHVELDDTLDDLLNETSSLTNQNRWYQSQKVRFLDDNSFFDTL